MPEAVSLPEETPAQLAVLLENHRAFLRYLERRVGDRELAEDILQDAFTKVIARPDQAPANEAIVPLTHAASRSVHPWP
jgi:RNA polymerase sigma-70 factor (ECF subfamily)